MSRLIKRLKLECKDCAHRAFADSEVIKRCLGEALSYNNIAEIFSKFSCSKCKGRRVRAFDDLDRLLIDSENIRRCQVCDLPILLLRIQTLPETAKCQTCADEGAQPRRPPPYPTPPPSLSVCPRCKRKTIVRENSVDNNYFIGCTGFPKCRWTADLPQ